MEVKVLSNKGSSNKRLMLRIGKQKNIKEIRKMLVKRFSNYLILAIIVGLMMLVMGCVVGNGNNNDITGSGNLESRDMNYTDFSKIVLSQGFVANISQNDTFSINITMDDNLYDHLDARQLGDTLHLGLRGGSYRDYTAKVAISMPELNDLELSSASRAEIIGFGSIDSLDLTASSASQIILTDLEISNLKCLISSASRVFGSVNIQDGDFLVSSASIIQLEGSAKILSLDVSSASVINLANLDVVDMDITLTSASNATINVSGILNLGVHASSYLMYLGDPTIGNYDVSGSSEVDHG
jgi:hypothetical protein